MNFLSVGLFVRFRHWTFCPLDFLAVGLYIRLAFWPLDFLSALVIGLSVRFGLLSFLSVGLFVRWTFRPRPISNFEIICIWPKIGQILFFSTILDFNLTKSPTYFIFGEYAVGGVSNFVLVFEKNRTGRFKVIRTWFFLFLKNHIKRFNSTLKLVFIYFLWL